MNNAFDETALMEEIEGDLEFLKESVSMFNEDTPLLLEQIRAGVSSGDAGALVKLAHTLKGLLGNFCARPAQSAAHKLESMAREARTAGLEEAFKELQGEVLRLRDALDRFVQARTQ